MTQRQALLSHLQGRYLLNVHQNQFLCWHWPQYSSEQCPSAIFAFSNCLTFTFLNKFTQSFLKHLFLFPYSYSEMKERKKTMAQCGMRQVLKKSGLYKIKKVNRNTWHHKIMEFTDISGLIDCVSGAEIFPFKTGRTFFMEHYHFIEQVQSHLIKLMWRQKQNNLCLLQCQTIEKSHMCEAVGVKSSTQSMYWSLNKQDSFYYY